MGSRIRFIALILIICFMVTQSAVNAFAAGRGYLSKTPTTTMEAGANETMPVRMMYNTSGRNGQTSNKPTNSDNPDKPDHGPRETAIPDFKFRTGYSYYGENVIDVKVKNGNAIIAHYQGEFKCYTKVDLNTGVITVVDLDGSHVYKNQYDQHYKAELRTAIWMLDMALTVSQTNPYTGDRSQVRALRNNLKQREDAIAAGFRFSTGYSTAPYCGNVIDVMVKDGKAIIADTPGTPNSHLSAYTQVDLNTGVITVVMGQNTTVYQPSDSGYKNELKIAIKILDRALKVSRTNTYRGDRSQVCELRGILQNLGKQQIK